MAKPMVAIVGRPNVGKSMLFNKLAGKRLSIVEDTPGVTRDRLYADCDWNGREFTIVDTGGIEPRNDNEILQFMRGQAEIAIDNADVIVLVCDIRTGVTAADQDVANLLLRSKKPVVLAVNKADRVGPTDPDVYEFYNLGLGDPIAISAIHGHGGGRDAGRLLRVFPRRGGGSGAGGRHQGGGHRQAQRGQVLPGQPYPGGGAGHRQQRGRHHPGRSGQLL